MMAGRLIEAADRWLVPIAGTVTQCRMDFAFSLVVADDRAESFEVRIEQPFVVARDDTETLLNPEADPVEMAEALRMLRSEVRQVIAFKDGRLELTFDDGAVLRVSVNEDYEAWSIVGPRGMRIVSMPGGELAVWSPETTKEP